MLKLFYAFVFGLCLLQYLVPAFADAGSGRSSKGKGGVQLDSVTVTAQKREENLREVPVAIDAFTSTDLENTGITNYKDVTRLSPNVYMREATPESVTIIRGMSTFDGSLFAPVGFYVDDISYSMHHSHSLELLDIERVEVLKGPQGTLYGRNSTSGVINIITKKPGNDFEGRITGEFASYNTYRAGGDIKGPLVQDRLFAGLSFLHKRSDGYMTNICNNDDKAAATDMDAAKLNLRWTPSDTLEISLTGDTLEAENTHGYYHFLTGEDGTSYGQVNLNRGNIPPEMKHSGSALRVKQRFTGFNFLSVTGFRRFENFFAWDGDMGRPGWGDRLVNHYFENDSLSQEFRFSSRPNGSKFTWLGGLFGFQEDTDTYYQNLMTQNQIPVYDPRTNMEINGYALFGEVSYQLTPQIKITAGLRFDHTELEGHVHTENNWMYNNTGGLPPFAPYTINASDSNDEWLPKLSLSYHLTGETMIYTTVSKGYQSGGFNYFMPGSIRDFSYDKETSLNYELGAKATWFGNRLSTDLAFFYAEVSDKQVQETSAFNPLFASIANADEVIVKGAELSVRARPLPGLDLIAGIGYTSSVFEKYMARTPAGLKDVSGNKVPDVPDFTYNLGAQYSFENGFYARCDYMGTGETYSDVDNTASIDPYEIVNFRIGYVAEQYDIALWAKNLFDKQYSKYKSIPGDGSEIGVDGEARTIGITVTYRF